MAFQRQDHVAAALPDGRALVAGGELLLPLATAEIYDPAANAWRLAAPMANARSGATATLLGNGVLLVAGGFDFRTGYLASAELYDPVANSWRSAGPMGTPRGHHTATLLPSGQVLVVGSNSSGAFPYTNPAARSAELFDPVSGTWRSAGSPSVGRSTHSATLLADGRVLVAGGSNAAFSITASAELFDPAANAWSSAGSMRTARSWHTATRLPSGKVLVTGGSDGDVGRTTELYDPTTNSWSVGASMQTARSGHSANLLSGGRVLISGGSSNFTSSGTVFSSAELYFSAYDAWSPAGALTTARRTSPAVALADGKLLFAGGLSDSRANIVVASAETYDPGTIDDCLFDWAEFVYPSFFPPGGAQSRSWGGYYYRYYPQSAMYLASRPADGHVYYLGPASGQQVRDAGALSTWLVTARCQ